MSAIEYIVINSIDNVLLTFYNLFKCNSKMVWNPRIVKLLNLSLPEYCIYTNSKMILIQCKWTHQQT